MKPEKQLYQWDVNQYLTGINPAAQYVDYTIGNEVIRLETDGTRCRIPDEILQTDDEKTCYERYQGGTYRAYSFTVLYAPKPPDYVFTPEERTTFEALTARADAAIDEIERRADSGEFTPVKGKDYFTEAEKNEMVQSVSSGAVGEFREVVDSATADFNENSSMKTNDYNTNAETKTAAYDANAADKLSTYNSNAEQKLESYNQNHTEKVAEYNQNAETKTAEFDSNAAALQEQMAKKANIDGYYEEMTVGDAEQLVATQFVEDSDPYLFRPTGGSSDVGNRAYLDKIVGCTVAWNQQVDTSKALLTTRVGVTLSRKENGKLFLNGTATGETAWCVVGRANLVVGHKYLSKRVAENVPIRIDEIGTGKPAIVFSGNLEVKTLTKPTEKGVYAQVRNGVTVNTEIDPFIIDLTQMFGSTIADYIYSLEQSQAGAGVACFKKLFPKDYYAYNAGELLSVEGIQSHDTVGFNQWDEEWEVGGINRSTGENTSVTNVIRSANYIGCLPSTTYFFANLSNAGNPYIHYYDADKNFISYAEVGRNTTFATPSNAHYIRFNMDTGYGVTYKNDICINLNSPSRNGEYEPYEKHSYQLDSYLTLRGIPKLDASNNLYYDGDEYTSDGKVKRKYGVVTLDGTSGKAFRGAWGSQFNNPNGYAVYTTGIRSKTSNVISNRFIYNGNEVDKMPLYSFVGGSGVEDTWTFILPNTVTSLSEANAWLANNPTTIVYELATPTTETAEPFQNIQIVDDFGTEEFVSTGIVPVGHKTRYPANLRDKLQHLPSLAGADGTYLIQQSGKQMSLIHMPAVFPETPTDDGTYTLKTVVTGGVATLQWVAE